MTRWFKRRPVGGIGLAMGLVVLWHFEPLLMPWVTDEPLARALIAIGLAGVGALVAWLVLVVITRSWPGASSKSSAPREL
jgi:hypothetical protein